MNRACFVLELGQGIQFGRSVRFLFREVNLVSPDRRWLAVQAFEEDRVVRCEDELRAAILERVIDGSDKAVEQARMQACA